MKLMIYDIDHRYEKIIKDSKYIPRIGEKIRVPFLPLAIVIDVVWDFEYNDVDIKIKW